MQTLKGERAMRRHVIKIEGGRHLETLGNCGGFYSCPKGPDEKRLGPLVGYAGDYDAFDGTRKRFVGDIYANFAKAEPYANVLRFFAECLSIPLDTQIGLANIDVFCGTPIGGYSLADALGLGNNIDMIKAEKKVLALATSTSREVSNIVFSRHDVEAGQRVVIVEDVCNNFSTTNQLILNIRHSGAEVVAIVCFLNRSLTVNDFYSPGKLTLHSGEKLDLSGLRIPVISLVHLPINEWKQNDPAVAEDIAKGNVVWKPKDEWPRLMQAMHEHT
jgi:orotate phosphoribosyltransferase